MNNIKYYYIALAAVLTLGFSACTDEVEYQGASPVAEDCIRASFTSDGGNYTVASNIQAITGITVTRENTTNEATVALRALPQSDSNFQIPASVTFAAGSATATFDIPFSGLEQEELYTFSVALDNSAVDSYSESVLASTTGYVLQEATWNTSLGQGIYASGAFGQAPCEVMQAEENARWVKCMTPFDSDYSIVIKINEDNSVRMRQQALVWANVGLAEPQLVNISIDHNYDGLYNNYDPETGIITMAILLAEAAAIYEGLTAVQSQVYGPEARGGATRSDVIISDRPILFPKVTQPGILVTLNQSSFMKYGNLLRPGGLLLTDSHLVHTADDLDVRHVSLPLHDTVLRELGKTQSLNICTLGALVGLTGVVRPESVEKVLARRFPRAVESNMKALSLGLEMAKAVREDI